MLDLTAIESRAEGATPVQCHSCHADVRDPAAMGCTVYPPHSETCPIAMLKSALSVSK